jgi:hypothetical protein
LIMVPYMHRNKEFATMFVVARAFQVYLDTHHKKDENVRLCTHSLNIASGWPPNSSDTFNTSMRP